MAEKILHTRLQLKNDTEANWEANRSFVPKKGEPVIFNPDANYAYSRMKIGDGVSTINDIPFIDSGTVSGKSIDDVVQIFDHRSDFPQSGSNSSLYVDNETKHIYFYTGADGYSIISGADYSVQKTDISTVASWDPGVITSARIDGITLDISNGELPELELNTVSVVTDISRT